MNIFFEELKNKYKGNCIANDELLEFHNLDEYDPYVKVIKNEKDNKISIYITIYNQTGGYYCDIDDFIEEQYRDEYEEEYADDYNEEDFQKWMSDKLNEVDDDFESKINTKVEEFEETTGVKPKIIEHLGCGSVDIGYFNIDREMFENNKLYNI